MEANHDFPIHSSAESVYRNAPGLGTFIRLQLHETRPPDASTTFLFILLFLFIPYHSQAQCPSGWISGTTTMAVTLSCGPAVVQVTYCRPGPLIFPKEQYRIVGINILSPGPGMGCTIDGTVLRAIGKQLIIQNPSGFNCQGSCPVLLGMFTVSYGACMKEISPGIFETCPQVAAEGCADGYLVCCRCNGTLTPYYQGSGPSDQCEYEWGCITTCAPQGPIEPAVCN